MARDPERPPPRPAYLSPERLLEAYRLAAHGQSPRSPIVARYRALAAELGQEPAHTTGEPNSAPGAPPDNSRLAADGAGRRADMPAHFRNSR